LSGCITIKAERQLGPAFAISTKNNRSLARSGSEDRRLSHAGSRATATRASHPQRQTGQICGRRLILAKRLAPITCRDTCPRKNLCVRISADRARTAPFCGGFCELAGTISGTIWTRAVFP
jgi:hypothetical protein